MTADTLPTAADLLARAGVQDGRFTREFLVRAAAPTEAGDAWEFTAIGVPYGEIIDHAFGPETFDRGSVTLDPAGVLIDWEHGDVIGHVLAGQDTDAGHRVTAHLSATTQGRDAYTLLTDGVPLRMSIDFAPLDGGYGIDSAGVLHWTRVIARAFAITGRSAYRGAVITQVRTAHTNPEETTMTADTLTRSELDAALEPLNGQMAEFTRALATIGRTPHGGNVGRQYRSMGALLKALAAGDTDAAEFHRAYTGGTTADTIMKDSTVGEFIKLVQMRRRVVSLFKTDTLPPTGLSVDYYQLNADTTAVAKQAAQGDDLTKGKVTLKKANTAVDTYGGWTELSRQEVERATVTILDITLKALGIKYANVTEVAAKTVLQNQITTNLGVAGNFVTLGAVLAASTTDQWLTALINLAENFDTNGFAMTGLAVTKDVFLKLMSLTDGANRRVMNVYGDAPGAAETVGAINIPGMAGSLASVPVQMIPNAVGSWVTAYDPEAMITLESPGAPAQLQDENVINLSKQFSLYGYCAQIVPFPAGIVPVKLSA